MAGEEEESRNKKETRIRSVSVFHLKNLSSACLSVLQGFRLLGILDVQNTTCAREAILHGAGGSLTAGLLHFLATSRVRRSFDVGFAGFMLTTLGSWFYCRMNNAKLRVQQRMIQGGIKNKVVYEGTTVDPTIKPGAESGPS
ncbi:cytochrome c oxidase assembly protein COX20, mitochondrial [Labrus mixtus]|uniref:cytochrome c oxidase assembly protein COX20, mitochondrial n=1 Tax=Labrus mixtus TaxID=508554 RepID=UPI0029C0764E|nr:cytochrome c oxidase assembly protein COX20, mitochondrial [Labrus mixtus]